MIDETRDEVNRIIATLTPEQQKDCRDFEYCCEQHSGIFGCTQLWTIYKQAWLLWLLDNGHKLEHSSHKTAESLIGRTAGIIDKLHTKLKEKKEE